MAIFAVALISSINQHPYACFSLLFFSHKEMSVSFFFVKREGISLEFVTKYIPNYRKHLGRQRISKQEPGGPICNIPKLLVASPVFTTSCRRQRHHRPTTRRPSTESPRRNLKQDLIRLQSSQEASSFVVINKETEMSVSVCLLSACFAGTM
jgi:hypothetical protein